MGYTTRFQGELKFVHSISVPQLAALQGVLDTEYENGRVYIDFELTKGYDGIRHNGAEKSYEAEKQVNIVLAEMRKQWPEFGLTGELKAQGEDMEDRWLLVIEADGLAHKRKIAITGKRVTCPDCGHRFILESADNGSD